jgi:hypothetical protein
VTCVDASGYISRTSIEALPQNELVISGEYGRAPCNWRLLINYGVEGIHKLISCVYVFATGMGVEVIYPRSAPVVSSSRNVSFTTPVPHPPAQ